MLRTTLNSYINNPPDVIQFAKDRKYEEAWIIDKSSVQPGQNDIDRYLSTPFKLLIVEYIWGANDDSKRFVLTLFQDSSCKLQDHSAFVKVCLDLFYEELPFDKHIEKIDTTIVGHDYLLRNDPEEMNMSIFNHWMSVGPVELWRRGERPTIQTIQQKIHARPDIERSNLNYQGLLFRFNINGGKEGPVYGFKTPCCIRKGDMWEVDYDLVRLWIDRMIGGSQ